MSAVASTTEGNGEEREVAGCHVVITKPPKTPVGLTFLLPAANIPLSKYDSIRDALLSIGQVVVGFYINAFRPLRRNHRVKAEHVHEMFLILKDEFRISEYSLVGHSTGGKIALMVAALHDEHQVLNSVVALDPIDQKPVEFTNKEGFGQNLSLKHSKADITVTVTEAFGSPEHNGRAIHKFNQNVQLVLHRNAGHMAYCDEGGELSWKGVLGAVNPGNEERNEFAKKDAIAIIKGKSKSKVGGKQMRGMKKVLSETKAAAKEFSDDISGTAKQGASGMFMKGLLKGGL